MINGITPTGIYGVPGQQMPEMSPTSQGVKFSFKLPQAPEHVVPLAPQNSAVSQISEPTTWGQMLHRLAVDANDAQTSAGSKIRDVLAGGTTPIHEAMVSMQEANVRFSLLSEVRNKVLDAYQEIMRMQV